MLKEFVSAVLDDCFEIWKADGHQNGTREEFNKDFNHDFFDETVNEVIFKKDEPLWYACDKNSLFVMCLELIGR